MTATPLPAVPDTVSCDFDLVGGAVPDELRGRWTAPRVAEELGMHRKSVLAIPFDDLPWESTPGGTEREGRRYYREEDVRAFLRRREAGQRPAAERLEELERRMDVVERRLGEQQ